MDKLKGGYFSIKKRICPKCNKKTLERVLGGKLVCSNCKIEININPYAY